MKNLLYGRLRENAWGIIDTMTEQPYGELIRELSGLCGIIPEYWDIFGNRHETSPETMEGILRAMKCRIDSSADVVREIQQRKWGTWGEFLDPVHVRSVNDQPISVPVYIQAKEGEEKNILISWFIENEENIPSRTGGDEGATELPHRNDMQTISGDRLPISEEQWFDGKRFLKVSLADTGNRETGYYRMTVRCLHPEKVFPTETNEREKTARIIIAPDACYLPEEFSARKSWGLFVSLYAVRSLRNWGIGDFTDLKKLVAWIAGLQGGFVGINPLHAIPNTLPFGISPYSPITRLYKNYLYLDIEAVPEYAESQELKSVISAPDIGSTIQELRQTQFVGYEEIAHLKETVLRNCFEVFYKNHYNEDTPRCRKFREYLSLEGHPLESFALFMVIHEHMKKKGTYSWQEWPEEYHDRSGSEVRKFAMSHEKDVLFYQYMQWLIDQQLESIEQEVKKKGMLLGLYQDLAIGSLGGGSDAWSNQSAFAYEAEVGAPPDDFSPDGQKWGFPPLIPEAERETGYELFVQTMRKNMKRGGALRIDHALGMFRLFWIPRGKYPKDGAYVNYPFEDLIRIIALESVRNKTVVIAEDLGTVGDNVRETLRRFKMLSYRLLYFERDYPDPSFSDPDKYSSAALCAVTTHDLPTLSGYWQGRDMEVSKRVGKYPDETLFNKKREERERDKRLLISALKAKGVLRKNYPLQSGMTDELCSAVYQYLSLTPCRMVVVNFDDILGTLDQQNLPGTVDEHPNWVQKIPVLLEDAMKDRRFPGLAAVLRDKFPLPEDSL
ncbi:MAG: 4-alpha-glucanotransferase [Thermodesulfovibrionales bacterium]|nr:4-alpha-glucanotransferase [Thermodesulfovibrionales bacterium]